MDIEAVLDIGAIIGESPTWASAEKALYWIDVKQPALYRYDPATREQGSWTVPSDIGAFALVSQPPGAVVALRQGLFRLDLATGSLELLATSPFDSKLFRFNEGACDATGRFWVGVMFDPLHDTRPSQKSSLQSFTLGGACVGSPIPPLFIMGWPGARTAAAFIYRTVTGRGCSRTHSTRKPADLVRDMCSRACRRHSVCPMARPSTRKAAIGARCTAAAGCGATRRWVR
jgi:SMP-30/gluconolaconase/LRE-like protein